MTKKMPQGTKSAPKKTPKAALKVKLQPSKALPQPKRKAKTAPKLPNKKPKRSANRDLKLTSTQMAGLMQECFILTTPMNSSSYVMSPEDFAQVGGMEMLSKLQRRVQNGGFMELTVGDDGTQTLKAIKKKGSKCH